MRHFCLPFLVLAVSCFATGPAASATSPEQGKSCKLLMRAIVWSIDTEHGYMVLIDELDRQYVVNCDAVCRRGRSAKKGADLRVGDAVTFPCHSIRRAY